MGRNVEFTRVSGAWTVPAVDCGTGRTEWSAVWVGLGGYREDAPALEQVGTSADCDRSGRATYSTWYELVPDYSRDARLRVRPGHRVSASVTVRGRLVRLRLSNRTTGRSFDKRIVAPVIDLTSAEWIVEAPSFCAGDADSSCRIMPLADFGSTRITEARATSTRGRAGGISHPSWDAVRIHLDTRRGLGAASGLLDDAGRAFTVTAR